ncbi:MAG: 4Fe-4S dicluster domain-containing protein [archaeon GB-1845-036]|nr:4Fe-4S dicluster domain-containing protein [Candidatus Culexmicrobium thermophilum]
MQIQRSERNSRRFEIVTVMDRCKGCGICVSICPGKVLALSEKFNSRGYNYAYARAPEKCIGCKFCEYHCPDFAIFVKPSAEAKATIIK